MISCAPTHAAIMATLHSTAFPHNAWSESAFITLLCQPGVTGLIHPNGGLALIRTIADEAEILTLGVTEPRRGIGRALMQSAITHATQQGAKTMFLEVAASNTAALNLYKSLSFTPTGRRKSYYPNNEDALLLSRPLP